MLLLVLAERRVFSCMLCGGKDERMFWRGFLYGRRGILAGCDFVRGRFSGGNGKLVKYCNRERSGKSFRRPGGSRDSTYFFYFYDAMDAES